MTERERERECVRACVCGGGAVVAYMMPMQALLPLVVPTSHWKLAFIKFECIVLKYSFE